MDEKTPAADLLKCADEISTFLYGTPERRREIYGLSKADRKRLGLFHLGRVLHGSRSRIKAGLAKMADAGK